jgi:hypothetical protein
MNEPNHRRNNSSSVAKTIDLPPLEIPFLSSEALATKRENHARGTSFGTQV